MKVTRTDLHRCYSPISFTVIRTDADLKHISNAMMQVESKWSRRLQVLTEDYENGTFDKLVPPDAERLQAKADQEQRFKSFAETLAGGASYDF